MSHVDPGLAHPARSAVTGGNGGGRSPETGPEDVDGDGGNGGMGSEGGGVERDGRYDEERAFTGSDEERATGSFGGGAGGYDEERGDRGSISDFDVEEGGREQR
ncbi:MAG TPA: hypothetical protein VIL00_00290 [Pseudonocardiaceae bacterium]